MYEFNTRSGARRWKQSNEPLQPMLGVQVMSNATENSGQGVDRAEASSKREPSEKKKELSAATKPAAKPQQGDQKHQAQMGWERVWKRRKKSLRMWGYSHLTSSPKMNSGFKPECTTLQGASQLTPDLNSQRIRCDFSLSPCCKMKGGHKVCKPDPKAEWIWMYLGQVHVRGGDKKRKQNRVMDRSLQRPLHPTGTGSFPLESLCLQQTWHILWLPLGMAAYTDVLSQQWMGSPVPAEQPNEWKAHQGRIVC